MHLKRSSFIGKDQKSLKRSTFFGKEQIHLQRKVTWVEKWVESITALICIIIGIITAFIVSKYIDILYLCAFSSYLIIDGIENT